MNDTFKIVFGVMITGNEYVLLFRKKLKDQVTYARSVPTNPPDLFITYNSEENDIRDTWLQPYGKYLDMGCRRPLEYLICNVSEYIHYAESDDRLATEFILGKKFLTNYAKLSLARLERECKVCVLPDELLFLIDQCKSRAPTGSWRGEGSKITVFLLSEN